LEKSFLVSAVLVSLFCWLQCVLDIWLQFPLETFEVPRELTLLCPGCTSRIFGFPHPSGFAIEPQFMGNLLLAPTLYSFYLFLKLSSSEKPKVKLKSAFLLTFLLTTLLLVFSRGAIYSFGIGLIFLLLVWTFKFRLPTKKLLQTLTLGVISLVICLSAQAIFANSDKSPRSIKCTLSTSLAQLTLDLVNFDCRSEYAIRRYEFSQTSNSEISAPSAYEANHPQSPETDDSNPDQAPSEPVFSGYVAESTNIRLGFNQKALEVALETPAQFIFGSGLGSAGKILYERGKTSSEMEIVQNEYFSLLLETGLIGLVLLLLSLALLIKLFRDKTAKPAASPRHISLISSPESAFILSTILAFAFSLNFFSGLPNALHLYLFPVILLAFLNFSTKNLTPVSPRKTKP
ncbi:O-antigen ligase family protein, partial [Candidatus Saccharibacteria bacterium]|nr:O-antigen ligase family protein [Candidatus Saccharibacteria bacterium]